MIDPSLESMPLHEISSHPKVSAFLEKIKGDRFKIDLSLMDEIETYVSIAKETRESADKMRLPSRYKTIDDLHELAGFIAKVQARRDRVIEIKLTLMPLHRSIHRIYKKAFNQLYHFSAISKASPAPLRDAAMAQILDPVEDAMSKIDMLMEACAEADRHLGNAYFSLKELKAIGAIYIEAQEDEHDNAMR